MIFGIGTDIFCINRMRPLSKSPDDVFFQKAFTGNERRQANERSDPILYYSTRFAGKEAVYKAISQCGCDFFPADIEILDSIDGKPEVFLSGKTLTCLGNLSAVKVLLSLSWDGDYASAFALVELVET